MIPRMTALLAFLALLLSGPAFGAESLADVPQVVDAVADKPVIAPPSQPPGPPLAPDKNGREAAAEVENQRRFNELRRELVDWRDKLVDQWLIVVALVLTAMGVLAPIIGLIIGILGFQRFPQIKADGLQNVAVSRKHAEDAQKHAEDAQKLVDETRGHRDEAKALKEGLNGELTSESPDKAARAVESVQREPTASLIDQAIAAAVRLQQQEKIEEAVEKWRSIANVVGEEDHQLQARAWFSIGYLLSEGEEDDMEKAMDAYTKAVTLNPASAYNNRGIAKRNLKKYEDAIVDYTKAITLNPAENNTVTAAYNNRGLAKRHLGDHDEARADYQKALALAQAAGNENVVAQVRRNLSRLDNNEAP